MDVLLGYLLFAFGLVVYLICYLAIPFIVSRCVKLSKAKINIVVIVNVIVVFVLLQLVHPYLLTNIVMGVISVFIARSIMLSKCLEPKSHKKIANPTSTQTSVDQSTHICISEPSQEHKEYGRWNVYTSDIALDKSDAAVASFQTPKPQPSAPVATPQKASVPSKKAIGSGVYTIITILSIALIAACVVCIVLFSSISMLQQNVADLQEKVAELEKENEQYFEYYEDSFHKIDFLDSRIVFIENDGSNWYHRYECSRFVGNDWWAHNTEYAEYIGYDPCPYCFD